MQCRGVFQNSTSLKLVLSSGNLRQVDGDLKPYFPNPKILLGVLIQPFGGIFALGSEDFCMRTRSFFQLSGLGLP